jgi:predicted lipid-binding transport protein (Tim44 family)
LFVGIATAAALFGEDAFARAGGGQNYNSGGGSSGSGGSSGGGEVELLINILILIIRYPHIALPILFLAAVFFGISGLISRLSAKAVVRTQRTAPPPAQGLPTLKAADPAFSEILFLDLARLLYMRALQGGNNASISEGLVQSLKRRGPAEDVIFGSTSIESIQLQGQKISIIVYFDANYSSSNQLIAARERWRFIRDAHAKSPTPDRMQSLSCAACGSPLETTPQGNCRNCGENLSDGRLQWQAAEILASNLRVLPGLPLSLGAGVEEGTDMPLMMAPDLASAQRALKARHPEFVWTEFRNRAQEIFIKIQEAWASGQWEQARPYETDFLFQQHRFWMERYAREGFKNRLSDLKVTDIVLARISTDMWLETITVRIFARMKDWTENTNGKVIGGSKTEERIFSEYWTFIRSSGQSLKPRNNLDSCPSCGAPLDKVNQSGVCGYCEAKITGGSFDWVLALIDQDEVYMRPRSV